MADNRDQNDIEKVILGDHHAFEGLVDRYRDLIFTLSLRVIKDREEAEEAAQDTFVKAFRYLGNFKGESSFSTWLYRIAYNTALDRLRKLKRKRAEISLEDYLEPQTDQLESGLEAVEQEGRNKLIQEGLKNLSGDDGFLLTLYYFEDLSLDEISKIMNDTTNNLKVRLFRGRKRLGFILQKLLDPEEIGYYGK